MDIRKVKKLIEMLEESNLNEIEIKEGEEAVKLVKSNPVPSNFISSRNFLFCSKSRVRTLCKSWRSN